MSNQNDNNKRKTKLVVATIIAIIVLLLVGIVYQFVCIKRLERQIDDIEGQLATVEVSTQAPSHLSEFERF